MIEPYRTLQIALGVLLLIVVVGGPLLALAWVVYKWDDDGS